MATKKPAPKKTTKPAVKKTASKTKPAAKSKKYELKTKVTAVSVDSFIDKVDGETRRDDCRAVIRLMQKVTGEEPRMWGPSIVGFGKYHYTYASGHEGDMPVAGFSPRKTDLTIYLLPGFAETFPDLVRKLGKCKTSKACLYLKNLKDVDMDALEELVRKSVIAVKKMYPD